MARRGEFYGGSQLLQGLVPVLGLPLDQINFLVCQLLGLLLAFPFRSMLPASPANARQRLVVELVLGVALSYFCFGSQVFYLVTQSLVSYLLMKYGSPQWSHMAVFVFCMGYLSVAHILRQFYDYGGYTLDITGPLMIQTQKLTSLAFALCDGNRDQDKLSADQKSQSIREVPDVLSYFSFMFYFHGIMCGPLSFYSDYIAFINGSDLQVPPPSSSSSVPSPAISPDGSTSAATNGISDGRQTVLKTPDDLQNTPAMLKKLITAAVCGILMVTVPSILCPPQGLLEDAFFEKTFLQKSLYVLVCLTVSRQKYYFAWILGDTLNLAAGFGFNGYDNKGKPKWDLNENVTIWEVEFANSLKTNIDGWNKRTLIWLRRVVYDRAPKHQTLMVFGVSAFWHGFYPGYYMTFGTAALLVTAARLIRRNVRPWFQTSVLKREVYDAITFMFARMANVYICFPFLTLEFMSTLRVYMAQYCWMHVLAIATIIYFTLRPGSSTRKSPRSTDTPKQD